MNTEALLFALITCVCLEVVGRFYFRPKGFKPSTAFGWSFPLESIRMIGLFFRQII